MFLFVLFFCCSLGGGSRHGDSGAAGNSSDDVSAQVFSSDHLIELLCQHVSEVNQRWNTAHKSLQTV